MGMDVSECDRNALLFVHVYIISAMIPVELVHGVQSVLQLHSMALISIKRGADTFTMNGFTFSDCLMRRRIFF